MDKLLSKKNSANKEQTHFKNWNNDRESIEILTPENNWKEFMIAIISVLPKEINILFGLVYLDTLSSFLNDTSFGFLQSQ